MDNKIQLILNEINNDTELRKVVTLNQSQTARILGVSPGTLEKWRKEGIGIEYIKTSDSKKSRILYTKVAIAEYLSKTIKVI